MGTVGIDIFNSLSKKKNGWLGNLMTVEEEKESQGVSGRRGNGAS